MKAAEWAGPPSPARTNVEDRNKSPQSEPAATAALPRVVAESQISEKPRVRC